MVVEGVVLDPFYFTLLSNLKLAGKRVQGV